METLIEKRKREHVEKVLKENIQYDKTPGFEKVEFEHNALPEVDFEKIDITTKFLGKKLKAPIMILGMTGGYQAGREINRDLARAAQKHGLALGVGSQRAMLEDREDKSYEVRDVAPDVPIIGNIGAVQLHNYSIDDLKWLVEKCEYDGLAIHLNALQEVVQPEGDTNFEGLEEKIKKVCKKLGVPIVVKETGAGISKGVAKRLEKCGVEYLDVSGAGGSSWSKVEYLRGGKVPGFENWGISTVQSIRDCSGILPLISSGGVRSGIDVAKSIALGCDIGGAAYPFLKALKSDRRLDAEIIKWSLQVKICCFLTGSTNIKELKKARLILSK